MHKGRILICGDLHGSVGNIRNIINQIEDPQPEDDIIVCGDAGFEYESFISSSAKKAAKKFPGSWIVMRGNHDSRYWKEHCDIVEDENGDAISWRPQNGWEITDNGMYLYQKKYPNIKYVYDDGGLYNIKGYGFLFIPGAYSVDKEYRLIYHKPWNPQEQLSVKEQYRLFNIVIDCNISDLPIDFVIGHTFPLHIEPYYKDLFLDFIDQASVDKSMEAFIHTLSEHFEKNPSFKQYFGGHIHDDRELTDKYTMLYHTVADIKDYL